MEVVCIYLYGIVGEIVELECIDVYFDCGFEMLLFVLKYMLLKMCWVFGYFDYYFEVLGGCLGGCLIELKLFNVCKFGVDMVGLEFVYGKVLFNVVVM